ncbi:SDR family NAD(P)-dependent oxidoreductase [Mangrovimicrobium sediminis]|uniref:SDR family NAD(P)-dependent oxidoreductase n=1 Tax=Mangrovimicrobium sediminis TaxID=2562682 RepID=A0A4Z0M1F8_9GAMM|nr:oxidoreductase [Haliea sp. SAOS-164]TGD73310.1 SDR family NAD(P)-dependent oxidoreductase [Haliea sp. SAOS-164]
MAANTWNTADIPAQDGRVAVVTGASSGIGLAAAEALAAKGAQVILAVRDMHKGRRALDNLTGSVPEANAQLAELDLADLASVRAFAAQFADGHERLDLLINNAGIMMCPYATTRDGFEIQFGTNHLGHFALTGLLLPLVQATPGARVVTVSSLAHRGGNIDFDDPNWERREYNTGQAYCDSKLANLLFVTALSRKLADAGSDTLATAAHPGWTRTDLQRHVWKYRFLGLFMGQDNAAGALPTLRAAVDPQAGAGDYFGPGGRNEMRGPPVAVACTDAARDTGAAARLWALSEALTGVEY